MGIFNLWTVKTPDDRKALSSWLSIIGIFESTKEGLCQYCRMTTYLSHFSGLYECIDCIEQEHNTDEGIKQFREKMQVVPIGTKQVSHLKVGDLVSLHGFDDEVGEIEHIKRLGANRRVTLTDGETRTLSKVQVLQVFRRKEGNDNG